jgi:hypothetical protein
MRRRDVVQPLPAFPRVHGAIPAERVSAGADARWLAAASRDCARKVTAANDRLLRRARSYQR